MKSRYEIAVCENDDFKRQIEDLVKENQAKTEALKSYEIYAGSPDDIEESFLKLRNDNEALRRELIDREYEANREHEIELLQSRISMVKTENRKLTDAIVHIKSQNADVATASIISAMKVCMSTLCVEDPAELAPSISKMISERSKRDEHITSLTTDIKALKDLLAAKDIEISRSKQEASRTVEKFATEQAQFLIRCGESSLSKLSENYEALMGKLADSDRKITALEYERDEYIQMVTKRETAIQGIDSERENRRAMVEVERTKAANLKQTSLRARIPA